MIIHKPFDKKRILVEVLINPLHKVTKIIIGIEEKIAMHIVKLSRSLLDTQDIYFSYNKYW